MKKYIFLATTILTILSTGACKKSSSETETTPSLSGLKVNSVPEFVAVGDQFVFNADTRYLAVSDDSAPTIGLYWQVNTAKKDTLTKDISKSNPSFTYTVDTLGTYNVYCYAFAGTGYYNTSANASFKAVDPATVVSGLDPSTEVTFGANYGHSSESTWMTHNLNNKSAGISYRNSPVLDDAVGRLYNWEEALSICPTGWRLPSVSTFIGALAEADGTIPAGELMADATFLGEKMWEYFPEVPITNASKFNAIPLGYVDMTDGFTPYGHYGEYACFWTSDSVGEPDKEPTAAKFVYITASSNLVRIGQADVNTFYTSVRCVKDN